MADRYPLVVDPSNYRIQELPEGDNLNFSGSLIVNATFSGITTLSQPGKIVVGAAGSLGIGTDNPRTALQVGFGTTSVIFANPGSLSVSGFGTLPILECSNTSAFKGDPSPGDFVSGGLLVRTSPGYNDIGLVSRITLANGEGSQVYLESISRDVTCSTSDFVVKTRNGPAPTEKMRVTAAGNVGIATTAPAQTFHLNGTFRFTNRGTPATQTALHVNAATGDVVETASSRKYKRDIEDYAKGLETVLQLHPVSFKYQDDENPNAGLIAEEVDELGLPEFVRYIDGEPHSIPYENFTALLINAIKDLKAENDALKARLDAAGL